MKQDDTNLTSTMLFCTLFGMAILRLFTSSTTYIPTVNFIALMAVLGDVTYILIKRNISHSNLNKFKGACILIAAGIGIIVAIIVCCNINIPNNVSDFMSLIALAIGIPNNLAIRYIEDKVFPV